MAANAHRLRIHPEGTAEVFRLRYRFKVVGVYAPLVSAKVVDLQSVGD